MELGFWFLGGEAWDDGNISDNQGWKQIGSGLRSGSPSSFWICSSSVSPCFGELELFILELEESRSGPDRSQSVCQKWGNSIKKEQKDGTVDAILDNQHNRFNAIIYLLKIIIFSLKMVENNLVKKEFDSNKEN